MKLLIALVLSFAALSGTCKAESPHPTSESSAASMLPGCLELVHSKGTAQSPGARFCSGTIDTLLYLGELLPDDYSSCVPLDIPCYQVVQTVVDEVEAVYPSVHNQLFKGLALEVLHYRWPCRSLAR
jgi:hypothetical protein